MRQRGWLSAFAAVVLSLALPGGALLGCLAGPADSAMEQMACCKNGHHDCGTTVSPATCCETGDHSSSQTFAKTLPAFDLLRKLPVATGLNLLMPVPLRPAVQLSEPHVVLFAGTTSPPRLAFLVLLI